jgi:hypothetical protein
VGAPATLGSVAPRSEKKLVRKNYTLWMTCHFFRDPLRANNFKKRAAGGTGE